jgi:hypothetical protein
MRTAHQNRLPSLVIPASNPEDDTPEQIAKSGDPNIKP